MGIISSLNMPNVGQQLQQSDYLANHPQTRTAIMRIQDPNSQVAMESLRLAIIQSNRALWTLAEGEHPVATKEVERSENAPRLSIVG